MCERATLSARRQRRPLWVTGGRPGGNHPKYYRGTFCSKSVPQISDRVQRGKGVPSLRININYQGKLD